MTRLFILVDNFFLEIEQGKIRWYHINPAGHKVFFIVTESLLPAKTWVHVAGTYSVLTGEVKFYINAEESKITKGDGNNLSFFYCMLSLRITRLSVSNRI